MSEKDSFQSYLDSCRLVTARLVESIVRNNQWALSATPEMEELFGQWRDIMAHQILDHCPDGTLDPEAVAEAIGVTSSTVLSLLLSLHRSGEITLRSIRFDGGPGTNREICDCLRDASE